MIIKDISENDRIFNFKNNIEDVYLYKIFDNTNKKYLCNKINIKSKNSLYNENTSSKLFSLNNDSVNNYSSIIIEININLSDIKNNYIYVSNDILNLLESLFNNMNIDYTYNINKYYNLSIDLDLVNNFINDDLFFDKVNRIFNGKLTIYNILRSKSSNAYIYNIDNIKFINVYKLVRNNEIKYVVPYLNLKESYRDIFIDDMGFELDISSTPQDVLNISFIDLTNIENKELLFNYSILFNYFDIFNNNIFIPKFIFNMIDVLEGFKFLYGSDVFSRYFGSEFMDVFKSRIIHKILNSNYDILNVNINNLILSKLDVDFTDQSFSELKIFIFVNNIEKKFKDNFNYNILNITDKYNMLLNIIHDYTYESYIDDAIEYHIKFLSMNDTQNSIIKNSKISVELYNNYDKIQEDNIYIDNILSRSILNKEYAILSNNIFTNGNKLQFNRLKINNNIYIISPLGIGNNIQVNTNDKIIFSYSGFDDLLFTVNNHSLSNYSICNIIYSLNDGTTVDNNIYIKSNNINKNLNEFNNNIIIYDHNILENAKKILDNIYIEEVNEIPLYYTNYFTNYSFADRLIKIKFKCLNDPKEIINFLMSYGGIKLELNLSINNNNFNAILDIDHFNINENYIELYYNFSFNKILGISRVSDIIYFKINKITIKI